ncbi:nitroreductase family protein [Pseudomarimonas arenosa]|uniref:Putative NAD(P)H nitroreductase n=1 Tax=Pseudomarimonas arenosa TaxID=2774145 RepID=A0AAW3ZQL2_9GAMM|nr:nitroreductase [Pseudomarimonas arenosa]MBD8526586.1 nitroreductase [Pseudomarimonas arenosa]
MSKALTALELLQTRRSVPCAQLQSPAPNQAELEQIVALAMRVPDHGKLTPWRVLALQDEHKGAFADWLYQRHRQREPEANESVLQKDPQRFRHSPLVLVIVSTILSTERIPEQEQLLSGGCVCYTVLQAAAALGYSAQWLTGWAAYDTPVAKQLGLSDGERILGFIHLGRADEVPPERVRPALADKLSFYRHS